MRRADRLFQIIERLRRRGVVTARVLADHLKVSERTIYRGVADLIASQVPIEGAAGIGYSLCKGYDLPPLMFTESELDALVFGARMVRTWSDAELGQAAEAALAKIEGVLPVHLQRMIEDRSLWAPADARRVPIAFDLGRLRGDSRSPQARFMAISQVPISTDSFTHKVRNPAWKTKPTWYMVGTADRSINPDQERMMAKRARAKTVEVNASHVAYMSHPKETAKLIEEAAASSITSK